MKKFFTQLWSLIKSLFCKKVVIPDITEDFKDHFDFGLYCNTAWYYFKEKHIPYEEIKNMGIDYVYEQPTDITAMKKFLNLAKEAGLKMLFSGYENVYNIADSSLKKFLSNVSEAFIGIIAYDEPHLNQSSPSDKAYLEWIKENIIDKFRTLGGKSKSIINCLPNYARASMIDNGTYDASTPYVDMDTYIEYVTKCAKLSDVVMGDFYGPYNNSKEDLWIPYLQVMKEISSAYNKPMWQFISCTKQGGSLEPTEDRLKYRIYLNLMFGAQSMIFFKMLDYNSTDSPYKTSLTKSDTYYTIQKLLTENSEVRKLTSLFKNATVNNIKIDKENSIIKSILKKNNHSYVCIFALDNTTIKEDNIKYSVSLDGTLVKMETNLISLDKGSIGVYMKK